MKECPFCNLELIEQQEVVLRNELCMFLQAPQEVLVGSGLIIPIKHRETVFDLTEEEWSAAYGLLQDVKTMLDGIHCPDCYNIGWNVNAVGGQHILHAHLHIIPRFKDEPYAGKGIRYWLKRIENKRNTEFI
ncbi:HIT domain-containing protein [Bacillus mangrovi]|uniref:HIT domain-containing protein n=1 Tax=Metabacillus mangrovi TaxID=1491830 RepID=A0A7X2V686_9BACI|nr:HIT domain-containing protein [Metabacillus mangrovi]MTH54959.1 HIT domain-containing protein [Metabacillus mangrovi]